MFVVLSNNPEVDEKTLLKIMKLNDRRNWLISSLLSVCLLAVCYDGPLDLFGELHVFPENVSFAALQILIRENRCKHRIVLRQLIGSSPA